MTTKSLSMSHVKIYIKIQCSLIRDYFFCSLNKIIYSLKGNSRRLSYLTLSFLAASHLYLHCLLKLVCD